MPQSGDDVTAALLTWEQNGTSLSDDSASATGTWEQWGSETVQFSNPGLAVTITAMLSGSLDNGTDAASNAFARVAVSLDGGSTWSIGNNPSGTVGTTAGLRESICALATVSGTPTGDIIMKAEFFVNSLNTTVKGGWLQATVTPQ